MKIINVTSIKGFILKDNLGDIYENTSFKDLTTLKCGGKIALLYYPNSINNFLKAMQYIEKVPYFVIGNGSNLLASDDYFDGVVISFVKLKEKISFINYEKQMVVTAHSGVLCPIFAKILLDKFLSGGEALSTIPATLGGIIAMNASCYDFKTEAILTRALIYSNGEVRWYKNYELEFGYRTSKLIKNKMICLAAEFIFYKENINVISKKINFYKELRKKTQPNHGLCAGSTFKNNSSDKAWTLIEKAGLRGYIYKNVKISEEHTNFLINLGNAKSEDIKYLIDYIKSEVKKKENVELKEEFILFNFSNKNL